MKFLIITNDGSSCIIETEDILSAVKESWNAHYDYDHILSVTKLESEDVVIKALEEEPQEDYISRTEAIKIVNDMLMGEANHKIKALEQIQELPTVTPEARWIPVSKRLPKDYDTYLITLENGDVCKCEFNPDYIDEEHDKGAFTYYHDYFDSYTLGLIDSEEIAVDAIAWMPFESYKAEGE